jgi:hypothetical protein
LEASALIGSLKMSKVPYNGYLEIWLQRVTKPKNVEVEYISDEPICKIVNRENIDLWNSSWISSVDLKAALNASKIVIKDAGDAPEFVAPSEAELFKQNTLAY